MDTSWCWLPQSYKALRMYFFWGPVFLIWIFNCLCYYAVRKKLREMLSFLEKSASRRILGYILIFILVSIPPLSNRIAEFFMKPNFILFCIHSAFDPLIGFCNAIVYGWNKQLRHALQTKLCGNNNETSNLRTGVLPRYNSAEDMTRGSRDKAEDDENPDY